MLTNNINKKIRLILYAPTLAPGGTERVVLNLCRSVSRDRFDISVCTMEDGLFADEIRALNIEVKNLGDPRGRKTTLLGKAANYLRMLRTLRTIIKGNGPTVVHSHHFGPLMQLFFLRKFFWTRFGWLHTEHSWTDVKNEYANFLCRLLNPMKSSDIISGVADKITSYMQEVSGISPDLAVTVLNGIETELFRPEQREVKRQELGFGSDDLIVGTVGQLRTEKNQQLAIRALALLAPEFLNLHLAICGEGVCRSELEQLAVDLGIGSRVHFLGFRLDAYDILSTFDVFCLPSVYEGLPLSILEAWAARRPVVATDVIGINEIVRHEKNGLLVPLNNEQMMAEAFRRLLCNPQLSQELSDCGHAIVRETYDISQMVSRYERFYEKIANQ